ncbi:STAS domain-containing protein [bacterium]|nr:STAS domain-containing protein [bacterium]
MKQSSVEAAFESGFLVLRLKGYFDKSAGVTLVEEFEAKLPLGVNRCFLDFSQIVIINSPGITCLLDFAENIRYERKIPLGCMGISQMYIEIFDAVGLSELMTLFPDETSARTSL